MSDQLRATRTRRGILAAGLVVTGILGIAIAARLVTSPGSNWRELYSWYNPAVGFHSASLPVGFEDLVDRVKPTVVGVRAKVKQDADEEERPPSRGVLPNRSDLPKGGPGMPQPHVVTTQGSGFFISSDGYAMTT